MSAFTEFHVLPNGSKMPIIGLGTWQATNSEEVRSAVDYALEVGYRHFDTAAFYRNEADIGAVFKKWIDGGKLNREDLFVTTKLPEPSASKVEHHITESLKRLQLDYVDLYLIHMPFNIKQAPRREDQLIGDPIFDNQGNVVPDMSSSLEELWAEMEKQVDLGRAKEIGISNFNGAQTRRIVNVARILPATNQVELHAYFQQRELREVCEKYNVPITSYSSLGSYSRPPLLMTAAHQRDNLLENKVVLEIGKKHNKSAAQILLRHLAQQGIVVIPKSVNPKRIKENFEIFDFRLNLIEMKKLDALDKGYAGRSNPFNFFKGLYLHPEFPHEDIVKQMTEKE